MEVEGRTDGAHFRLVCARCGVETRNEYGADYRFVATCPSCSGVATLGFEPLRWRGLPATPAV
jgi:hypothetical protein